MNTDEQKTIPRPPIVVVMGHIDHGKSTLLDFIRNTNIVDKEKGGITQHISAYEVEFEQKNEKRKIIFLDTPGHEAFCAIRERGSSVADIAVLVVSAEDGVKPQTIEALKCIKDEKLPFIVAINKIDRPGADIDRVKTSLAENEVLVEGWGGTVPFVPISAKTGEGVSDLIDMIILQSDIEDFRGDPNKNAEGFVIESDINSKKGISSTLIIKNGSVNVGMFVATNGAYAPIRTIENFKSENIETALFSSPIKITGWSNAPIVGSKFKTFTKKYDALSFASTEQKTNSDQTKDTNIAVALMTIVIKADTFGSLDAVEYELKKLGNDKIIIKIISKNVGTINEKDLKIANTKKSLILGFNVGVDKNAEAISMRENIEIKTFTIIYDLVNFTKEKLHTLIPVEMVEMTVGSAKIVRVFSQNKDKFVVGGRVEQGELKSGGSVKIYRRDIFISDGKIKELQIQKIKTNSVMEGQEFGMMIESKVEVVPNDIIKSIALMKQ